MTDDGARDPLIGSLFNNYRIDALLAQGGMGAVYLVRDATLPNIRKVLKVVLPEFANNPSIRDRFLHEAEAVSMLRHPNIVGIDAVGLLPDGRLGMVIPFLEGKPLDQFLAEHGGRLAPHRVMHIVAHIARGLDYVHRQGIIHRDLKPGNVFVEPTEDDRDFCKVLDFGIAKHLNAPAKRPSSTRSAPMGTPCYMAVEQYANPGDVTPAADVFALSVMTWQMVTGELPWGEHDPVLLYQKQLHDPPNPPVGRRLSPEWEAILRTALSPDPRLRPQSMRQLVQVLASALPAIEPLYPSGAEILRSVARNLLTNSAHDDETVRNQSGRPLVPAWPVRETPLPPGHLPQSAAAPAASSPPTGHERRGTPAAAPAGPQLTTLGSSAGTIEPRTPAPNRRTRALLGLAAAVFGGVVTFALVTTRGGGNATPATEAAGRPVGVPPSTPMLPPSPPTPSVSPTAPHGIRSPAETAVQSTTADHPSATGAAPTPAPVAGPADDARATSSTRHGGSAELRAGMSNNRPKPKASLAPPIPNRAPVDPPRAGSGRHHFDPNAIGGQEGD